MGDGGTPDTQLETAYQDCLSLGSGDFVAGLYQWASAALEATPDDWVDIVRISQHLAQYARVTVDVPFLLRDRPEIPTRNNGQPAPPDPLTDDIIPGTVPAPDTDTRNAERFAAQHQQIARYCVDTKEWRIYTGAIWERDPGRTLADGLAKQTVRALYAEVATVEQDKARAGFRKWAQHSESAQARLALVRLAQAEPALRAHSIDFDRQPHLLVCANGVLDLHTRVLHPHHMDFRCSRQVATPYEPAADCPQWLEFLHTTFAGDATMIDYVHRALGWSLTGDVSEEVFFVCHGGGNNGKSTLLSTVDMVLGPYAVSLDDDFFLLRKRSAGQATPELMALRNARFAYGVELPQNRRLAEAFLKRLTGGDPLTGRQLFQEQETFRATAKLWIGANSKPIIRDMSVGMWRRVHLIPFTVTIPPETRKKTLKADLLAEAPGILAWLVRGCLAWQQQGLDPPDIVKDATQAYHDEMDVMSQFFDQCCEVAHGESIPARELYDVYVQWAKEAGADELRPQAFSVEFGKFAQSVNIQKHRMTRGVLWRNCRLQHSENPEFGTI